MRYMVTHADEYIWKCSECAWQFIPPDDFAKGESLAEDLRKYQVLIDEQFQHHDCRKYSRTSSG